MQESGRDTRAAYRHQQLILLVPTGLKAWETTSQAFFSSIASSSLARSRSERNLENSISSVLDGTDYPPTPIPPLKRWAIFCRPTGCFLSACGLFLVGLRAIIGGSLDSSWQNSTKLLLGNLNAPLCPDYVISFFHFFINGPLRVNTLLHLFDIPASCREPFELSRFRTGHTNRCIQLCFRAGFE